MAPDRLSPFQPPPGGTCTVPGNLPPGFRCQMEFRCSSCGDVVHLAAPDDIHPLLEDELVLWNHYGDPPECSSCQDEHCEIESSIELRGAR